MQNIVTRKIFGFVLQFLVLHTYEGKRSLRQKLLHQKPYVHIISKLLKIEKVLQTQLIEK
jgi:hypothetical protein